MESVSLTNPRSFSVSSDQYKLYRPPYPGSLFAWLSGLSNGHDCCWDCATGNGQAAVALARYFSRVEATDISPEQIQQCLVHARVRYSVSPAEKTDFAENCFDVISVAQAIHWFDLPAFYSEVERVLKPGGILAVWGYSSLKIDARVDSFLEADFYRRLDPFWASGNRLLMDGYRELSLPYTEIPQIPSFEIELDWDFPRLLAYFNTWSAVKRCQTESGEDPMAALSKSLPSVWGCVGETKCVRIPLTLKVCRKP